MGKPIPKPAPPTRNKGKKQWDAFRQRYLKMLWEKAYPQGAHIRKVPCRDCSHVILILLNGKRFQSEGVIHHGERRLSHPEKKYDMDNLSFIHKKCHEIHHT